VVLPHADLAVLVGGDDGVVVGEGDGFGGVGGGGGLGVEGVDGGAGVAVVDVDFVVGCGVEEVVVDSEGGDGARKVWLEGGDAMVGDGEGEVLWREALERWNGWEGLYGEVAFERGSAVVGGCGRCRCFGNGGVADGIITCMFFLFGE